MVFSLLNDRKFIRKYRNCFAQVPETTLLKYENKNMRHNKAPKKLLSFFLFDVDLISGAHKYYILYSTT